MLEPESIYILAVVFLAIVTQSAFGFGTALVAIPLLCLVVHVEIATALIALVSTTAASVVVVSDWKKVQMGYVSWLLFFSVLGIPVGLFLLKEVEEDIVKAALALVIISFALYCLIHPSRITLEDNRFVWVFGFSAGVLGGAFNMFGPPVVVYSTLRQWPAQNFRATLLGYFFPIGIILLISHWLVGLWVAQVMWLFLASLPVVLVGVLVGTRINRFVQRHDFLRYVHMVLVLVGLMLLVQSVIGLAGGSHGAAG